MSKAGFVSSAVLSVVGTAAIYVIGFKNPALLKELIKDPTRLRELDLLYVGTRSANRFLQTQTDSFNSHSTNQQVTNQQASQAPQAPPGAGAAMDHVA